MNKANSSLKVVVGLGKTGISCIRYLLGQRFTNLVVMDSRQDPPGLQELRRNFPAVQVCLGGFDEKILLDASTIIVSPGVSLSELPVDACLKNGVEVIGDVELFVREAKAPIVAITGSNGKSTVAGLLGEMIKSSGKKVSVGGNFGVPALELLNQNVDFYVLELSSFQLETTKSLRAKAAVVLNVFPDHLDRYQDLSHYLMIKQRIYSGCEIAVVNRDMAMIYEGLDLSSKVIGFGIGKPKKRDMGFVDGYLMYGEEKLLSAGELKIKGAHNIKNALAALALGVAIDLPLSAMISELKHFIGLPHRCQWLAKINNVDWYNDSKATNVGATKSAIEGLGFGIGGKIILIAGGVSKGSDFSLLREVVEKYVRGVVVIGKDAGLLKDALSDISEVLSASSLEEAVAISAEKALSGDVVLFSPACASFDMFENFEHRGEVFIKMINGL